MKLGAISSLPKPFKPLALVAAVEECLERAGGSSASA
jgi:DNA-binding response OmpR family regulator